jgi:hypothetical protein
MVDYMRAIKRPFGNLETLVIGVILDIIPVVNLVAFGFQVKCAKTALNNDFKLPVWDDWAKLLISGLLAVIIALIYAIPGLVVMVATFGVTFISILGGAQSGSDNVLALAFGSMGIGMLVAVALLILAFYFVPAAIIGYAKNDDFGAAFKFKEVMSKALRVDYLVVWLLMAAYMAVLSMVLSIIPVVGPAFASFITGVTSMTAYAEVYDKK